MGCVFRGRFNQVGSIWYTVLSVLIQVYLLYLGFERYKLYTEMKWPHGAYPRLWLTVYIALLAICIPLLVLFSTFGIFKSGNLSGDGEQLGLRFERIIEITRSPRASTTARRKKSAGYSFFHCTKSIWQHSPPFPQTIHLILALCQLFTQQIMLAQLYRFGFINSGDFLNTELDFLYQRSRQLATNLPMGDSRLQGFRITSEELAGSPIAPNLLPILMHARLYGIPLEFVNFVVALIAYSCAYPSVFWRLSKTFSFCFSIHLIIHTINIIWSYLAFSILFRVQETNFYSVRPVGIGQHLWSLRSFYVYNPLAIIGIFILTILLMQISPILLYAYGFNKYMLSIYDFNQQKYLRQSLTSPQNDGIDSFTERNILARNSNSENSSALKQSQPQSCCDGYFTHIAAIFILLLIVGAKSSTLYALTLLYQYEEKPLILSCIGSDVIYLFSWIILWLALTIKRDWNFRVVHQVHEILSLQDAHRTADGNIRNKSFAELKNSLILMHRDHLFVTDDPFSKTSIMRHVLKSCAHDDIYWLQTNSSSTNRKIPLEETGSIQRVQYTPELGRLLDSRNRGDSVNTSSSPIALAPYQRLSSLPPTGLPKTKLNDAQFLSGNNVANTFGTLQRARNNNQNNNFQTHLMGCSYQSTQQQSSTLGRPNLQQNPNYMSQLPIDGYSSIYIRGPPGTYTSTTLERLNNNINGEYGTLANRPHGYISPQPQRLTTKLNTLTKQDLNTNSGCYNHDGNNQMYPNYNNSTKSLIQHYPDVHELPTNYEGILNANRSTEMLKSSAKLKSPNLTENRIIQMTKNNHETTPFYSATSNSNNKQDVNFLLTNNKEQIYGQIGQNFSGNENNIYKAQQKQQLNNAYEMGKKPPTSGASNNIIISSYNNNNNNSAPIWTAKKTSLTNGFAAKQQQELENQQITPSSSITTATSRNGSIGSSTTNTNNQTTQRIFDNEENGKLSENGTLTKNDISTYYQKSRINGVSDDFSTSVV